MKKAKKILAVILAVVTVAFAFAACSSSSSGSDDTTETTAASDYDAIIEKGKIVVGVTKYEPMDYQDSDGNWIGFDADLTNAVAEKMGVEVEFVSINWENRFTELSSGAIDCIWNGMTIDDSVEKNCQLSDPYAQNSQVVVMKKDVLDKYKDTDSLKGLTIAVEKGSAGEKEAEKLTDDVLSLTAQSDAIKEVKSGTSDACIIDSTMANSLTADGKNFDDLGYTIALTTEQYGIGFRKGSDAAEKINTFLDELREDGTMQSLSEKYGVNLVE